MNATHRRIRQHEYHLFYICTKQYSQSLDTANAAHDAPPNSVISWGKIHLPYFPRFGISIK